MKRKRYNLPGWHRWGEGTHHAIAFLNGSGADFRATTALKALEVPFKGRSLTIFDHGYRWIHYAPAGKKHALTVHLDGQNKPVQLYVDICEDSGIDPDGIPFVDDLYLDVIAVCDVQPDGSWHVTETEIIDGHELEEALAGGKVTPEQFSRAWAEAKSVEAQLQENDFPPLRVVQAYLRDHP